MSEAVASAESAGRRKPGANTSGRQGATASAAGPTLDDETAAALTLYNTYLIADREQQAHERAIRKAEKAKDEAAAAVRELNDRKASAAETAEAETAYREAAESLRRLRDGGRATPGDASDRTDDKVEDDAAPDNTSGGAASADEAAHDAAGNHQAPKNETADNTQAPGDTAGNHQAPKNETADNEPDDPANGTAAGDDADSANKRGHGARRAADGHSQSEGAADTSGTAVRGSPD